MENKENTGIPGKTEFNLSEKIRNPKPGFIIVEDVKEFIKRLKEKARGIHDCEEGKCRCYNKDIEDENSWIIRKEEFDKLAGDRLK